MSAVLDTPLIGKRTAAGAADILALPSVPTSYATMALNFALERGFEAAHVVEGCGFELALLNDADARLSTHQSTALMARVQQLTGEQALGYELGMRTSFTAHGMVGFGVMSSANLMEALEIGMRFFRLRNVTFGLQWRVVDDCVELEIQDFAPHALMRRTATEWLLLSLARTGQSLLPSGLPNAPDESIFRFPWSEPTYHARYKDKLPACQFDAPAAALRFPIKWLMARLPSAAASGVQLARDLCEKEMPLVAPCADTAERIRKALRACEMAYPSLDQMAGQLHVSVSTLKRRLQHEGASFSQLLDEARERDATHLLAYSALRIEDIAMRLGYQNTANFTRAFRKWMGSTPSVWRINHQRSAHKPGDKAIKA